ncbi:MAG: 4-hydroxy-3-methylbut-2-enyl diphosphate reductase, partial [Anaerovoracaceae bacterium]
NSLDEIEASEDCSMVIIRSHGEGKNFYDEAEEKNIELVDATCPFVAKIHKLVYDTDDNVVIVGDKDHPEVLGISGWCRKPAIIVSSYDEALDVEEDNLFVVTQTTIREDMLEDVLKAFRGKYKRFSVSNTICSAT